jgi:hypothetical protein
MNRAKRLSKLCFISERKREKEVMSGANPLLFLLLDFTNRVN